jgi:hypothetical protein
MFQTARLFLSALIALLWLFAAPAEAAPIVELTVRGRDYQGMDILHNKQICWLAAKDGSYACISLGEVSKFRKVGSEFKSLSPSLLAGHLRKELGKDFDVATRGDYVVCAPPGKGQEYLQLLNTVQKSFDGYFSRRGWKLENPEFPLTVIVYLEKSEFDRCCRADGMVPSPNLKGYYHPQTNRVTVFAGEGAARSQKSKSGSEASTSINTVVHEAIHQLAFNSGLHSRVGENPRWVVEGLATLLEAGALKSTSRDDMKSRINPERLRWFQEYRKNRRTGTIADLITRDEALYAANPLDFYSEAWALTFYLAEARRPDYVQYLKRISARDPLGPKYTAAERLADFQAVLGKDIRWVETQFLRFIDGLE